MTVQLSTILQELYDSEINVNISTFWDNGWDVKLGDNLNGFAAQNNFRNIDEVADWLVKAAIDAYPESAFAKKFRA
jgi:hypothetical protein